MKKYWNIISIVVCLLLLGAAVLMRVCPRKPSPEGLGRIYCLNADSKHIDAKTDLYSLAVSFVHICSGRVPYDRDTTDDYEIRKNIVEVPVDMTGVPQAWQDFLRPYLAKNPDERPALTAFPADAPALSAAVTPAAEGKAVSEETIVGDAPTAMDVPDEATVVETPPAEAPQKVPAPTAPKKPRKRKAWPWIVAASAVAVIGIVTAILLLRGCGSPSATNEPVEEEVLVEDSVVVEEAPVEEPQVLEAAAEKKEIEAVKPVPAGYVDLGLSVYWKNSNESGYYTYDEAVERFGNRMPTKEQYDELSQKCEWKWNGSKKGYDIKGPSGNSIFLPAAGCRECDGNVEEVGIHGCYWLFSPLENGFAQGISFRASNRLRFEYEHCCGHPVRLVMPKN